MFSSRFYQLLSFIWFLGSTAIGIIILGNFFPPEARLSSDSSILYVFSVGAAVGSLFFLRQLANSQQKGVDEVFRAAIGIFLVAALCYAFYTSLLPLTDGQGDLLPYYRKLFVGCLQSLMLTFFIGPVLLLSSLLFAALLLLLGRLSGPSAID